MPAIYPEYMREVSVVSVAQPPRRERKKRQTRAALVLTVPGG